MSTSATTSTDPGHSTPTRGRQREAQQPVTQQERSAATRLRATMAAMKLAFTWLGVGKTLAPEQRTRAARAFHADRELLSASKLILDTKNPAYRAVAAVRSEASSYWRTVTLPFPEAGIRLLPQNSLGLFANTMQTYREFVDEPSTEPRDAFAGSDHDGLNVGGKLFGSLDAQLDAVNEEPADIRGLLPGNVLPTVVGRGLKIDVVDREAGFGVFGEFHGFLRRASLLNPTGAAQTRVTGGRAATGRPVLDGLNFLRVNFPVALLSLHGHERDHVVLIG